MQAILRQVSSRIYFANSTGTYSRFMWIQEHKPFDLFVGIHGLDTKSSTLICQYSDQKVVGSNNRITRRYNYADAAMVNEPFNHFSFHPDGTFWLKLRRQGEKYVHALKRAQPIAEDTSIFQDFGLLSDLMGKYRCFVQLPKENHIVVGATIDLMMSVRVRISGIRHNIESEVKTDDGITGDLPQNYRHWTGRTLRAIFKFEPIPVGEGAPSHKRPPGTIATFLFPIAQNQWLTKGFHFK